MPTASGDGYPPVVIPSVQSRRILKGQKCLVTGANSGIDEAVVIALGRHRFGEKTMRRMPFAGRRHIN